MKKYINTSNYYLSTTTSKIENTWTSGTFDVSDVTVDWVTLPLKWYYWVDVDFGDVSKREIFRVYKREGYTLYYDDRISPNGIVTHQSWASVGLRDFSQLLNSLSTNTDNFWEIEKKDDLKILVRGWIVYSAGKANAETGKHILEDTEFTLPINETIYIVLSLDEIAYSFSAIEEEYLTDEWQYPIAKITTGATMISEIEDLRGAVVWWWNMRSEIYDPEWKRRELYLMDNMEQSEDGLHLFVTQAQVDLWNWYQTAKQDTLINWWNIVTIDWRPITGPDIWYYWPGKNVQITYKLWAEYVYEYTNQWVDEYTLQHTPISDDAFIVYTNSGTMLVRNEDYTVTYDSELWTYTLQFVTPAEEAESESYVIWILTRDWLPAFNIWDWAISFNVWWTDVSSDETFTVNQSVAKKVNLPGWSIKTLVQWTNLPDSKLTDNNLYFINDSNKLKELIHNWDEYAFGIDASNEWTTWQILTKTADWAAWADAPVQWIQKAPNSPLTIKYHWYWTQAQYDNLSQYYTDTPNDTVYFVI